MTKEELIEQLAVVDGEMSLIASKLNDLSDPTSDEYKNLHDSWSAWRKDRDEIQKQLTEIERAEAEQEAKQETAKRDWKGRFLDIGGKVLVVGLTFGANLFLAHRDNKNRREEVHEVLHFEEHGTVCSNEGRDVLRNRPKRRQM